MFNVLNDLLSFNYQFIFYYEREREKEKERESVHGCVRGCARAHIVNFVKLNLCVKYNM
jgi:hypothetical protein